MKNKKSKVNKKKTGQSSLLMNSARLSLLLGITVFLVTNMGPWTTPSIANHMFIKAIWAQMALSLLAVIFAWQYKDSLREWVFSVPRLLFLSLFIWVSLTIFWAANPNFFVFKWLMWLSAALIFYLSLQIDKEDIETLLRWLVYSALGVCFLAYAQMYFGFSAVPQVIVPAATFGNKNMLGQLMILTAPICFYLFMKTRSDKRMTWFYAIAYAFIVGILYHSVARATWIGYAAGLIVFMLFFLFDRKQRRTWFHWSPLKTKALLTGLMILVVLVNFRQDRKFEPIYEVMGSRITSVIDQANSYGTESSASRWNIWRATINQIKDKPIVGWGLGGFFEKMLTGYKNNKSMRTFRAHNDYLETWAEAGLIGFILLLSALLSVFFCAMFLLRKVQGMDRLLYMSLFAAGGSSLVNALFSFPFQLTVPLIIASTYGAFIIKAAEQHGIKVFSVSGSLAKSRTLLGVLSVTMVFAWFVNLDWWGGYERINKTIKTNGEGFETGTVIFNQEQVPILWAVGSSLNNSKNYQKSINMMQPLVKRWPDEYSTMDLYYNAYVATKQYRKAIEIAERGLSYTNQGMYGFYKKLFELYLSLGKRKEARTVYDRLTEVPEKDLLITITSYEYMILLAMKLGLDTPGKHYEDAYKNGKIAADIENNMIIHYITKNQRDKALIHIDRLIELNPNHININTFKAYKENPNMKLNFRI